MTAGESRGDVPFYVALAREAHGAVLVVGCSTGRILLPVAKSGADADAVEPNVSDAAAARVSLAERGLVADVLEHPLESFTCRRRHAGVIAAGEVWAELTERARRAASLRACRTAVAPGGWFAGDLVFDAATSSQAAWVEALAAAGFAEIETWSDFHGTASGPADAGIVWCARAADRAVDDGANLA